MLINYQESLLSLNRANRLPGFQSYDPTMVSDLPLVSSQEAPGNMKKRHLR